MIERFSPLSRRILAVGILLLAIAAAIVLILLPISGALVTAREHLSDARFRVARIEALASRPPADPGRAVPADGLILALDEAAASASFSTMLSATAAQQGVAITSMAVTRDPGSPKRLQGQLALSGPEVNVIKFIHAIEHGRPLVRFRTWKLASTDGAQKQLTMDGLALVAWDTGR